VRVAVELDHERPILVANVVEVHRPLTTKFSITVVFLAVLLAGIAMALDDDDRSGTRSSWKPDPAVTADTYVDPVLETSQDDRVAAVIAALPESLRLSGSGITIREGCADEDRCVVGAWYRGVVYLGTITLASGDDALTRVLAHEYGHVWSAVHSEESGRLRAMIAPLTEQDPEEALADCVKVVLGHSHPGYWACEDDSVRAVLRQRLGI